MPLFVSLFDFVVYYTVLFFTHFSGERRECVYLLIPFNFFPLPEFFSPESSTLLNSPLIPSLPPYLIAPTSLPPSAGPPSKIQTNLLSFAGNSNDQTTKSIVRPMGQSNRSLGMDP